VHVAGSFRTALVSPFTKPLKLGVTVNVFPVGLCPAARVIVNEAVVMLAVSPVGCVSV